VLCGWVLEPPIPLLRVRGYAPPRL
jgi:hypothetical protein